MKNLTNFEIECVSGGGAAAESGFQIGTTIGSIIDSIVAIFGKTTSLSGPSSLVGQGLGFIIDGELLKGFDMFNDGVKGIIDAFSSLK